MSERERERETYPAVEVDRARHIRHNVALGPRGVLADRHEDDPDRHLVAVGPPERVRSVLGVARLTVVAGEHRHVGACHLETTPPTKMKGKKKKKKKNKKKRKKEEDR